MHGKLTDYLKMQKKKKKKRDQARQQSGYNIGLHIPRNICAQNKLKAYNSRLLLNIRLLRYLRKARINSGSEFGD